MATTPLRAQTGTPYYYQYYRDYTARTAKNPGLLNLELEAKSSEALTQGWTTVLQGTATMFTQPAWSGVIRLPAGFAFRSGGRAVRACRVSSSGVLALDSVVGPAPAGANTALPSGHLPARVACLWGLALKDTSDRVITKMFGQAPHRQFWVQFNDVREDGRSPGDPRYYASIVLEETTNRIHFVAQFSDANTPMSLTIGVQTDTLTATQVAASPNVNFNSYLQSTFATSDNFYYTFFPGARPLRQLEAVDLRIARRYVRVGQRQPFSLAFVSHELAGTTAIRAGYRIDYEPPVYVSYPYSTPIRADLSGGMLQSIPLAPSPGWAPTTPGTHRIRAWIEHTTGGPDATPADDTITTLIQVAPSLVRRTPLVEYFTNRNCVPCRPVSTALNQLQTQYGPNDVAWLRYHLPGGDDLSSKASDARSHLKDGGRMPTVAYDQRWVNTGALALPSRNDIEQAMLDSSTAELTARRYWRGDSLYIEAQLRPRCPVRGGDLVVYAAVVQNPAYSYMTTTRTASPYVVWDVLPGPQGQPMGDLMPGQTLNLRWRTKRRPYQIAVTDTSKVLVAVWVEDPIHPFVMQTAIGRLSRPPQPLGTIAESGAPVRCEVVPNPTASGAAALFVALPAAQSVQLTVTDALGRCVLSRPAQVLGAGDHRLPIALPACPAGLYLVRLCLGETVLTRRLVVE